MFDKWAGWCSQRNFDPVTSDVSELANFLAHLFQQGYQYRSLNAYRSAIASVHDKVDGVSVGQHPLIPRMLKGAFHERPPHPRYTDTWDVEKVTSYIEGMGSNEDLSLQDLSMKLAMLLGLTRPSRSSDLCNLDIAHRRYVPEGVVFTPSTLAKQSRPERELSEFFFPAFIGNAALCPMQTLQAYESMTKNLRNDVSKLFIATIRPHRAVTSSTIARWLKSLLA